MNLQKEIHNFKQNEKTNISGDMFVLWEYKLTKTNYSRKSIFNILKSDNVHLKLDENKAIKSLKMLECDEFYFMLSLYSNHNKKLNKFVFKMLKD